MLTKNIIAAFRKLGLEPVWDSGRRNVRAYRNGRFAEWDGSKESTGTIYVSSDKQEEDWGHNDGSAGWFYDSISHAIAGFETFTDTRRLKVGDKTMQVSIHNQCSTEGRKWKHYSNIKMYQMVGELLALRSLIEATFSDPDQVAFLRGHPDDNPLTDFMGDHIPEFEALLERAAS